MDTQIYLLKDHAFTALFPPTRGKFFLITYNNKSILVEPFANLKNKHEIGSFLFDLLTDEFNKSLECKITNYKSQIMTCKFLYIKINNFFDIKNYFKGIRFVQFENQTKNWQILEIKENYNNYLIKNNEIDIEEQLEELEINDITKFYEINTETKFIFTNINCNSHFSYSIASKIIEKKLNTTILHSDILQHSQISPSQILVIRSVKELRKKEICQKVCYNLKINHLHINLIKDKELFFLACNKTNEKTMLVIENLFENDLVNVKELCKFIKEILQNESEIIFVFLVDNEINEKIIEKYFEEVETIFLEMPIIDKNGRMFKGMLRNIKNNLKEKEIKNISGICEKFKINEMEKIIKEVIDNVVYEKGDKYCICYNDFINVLKNKKMINEGFVKKIINKLFFFRK